MKRLSLAFMMIVASLGFMFNSVAIVRADSTNEACQTAPESTFCKNKNPTENPLFGPSGLVTRITQLANIIAGLVAVFVVTYGGMRYVMSSGDPQKLTAARNTILYGAIGIAVVVVAQAIISFILRNI